MYGMINKAIESMVITQFGEPTWKEILEAAGVQDTGFVTMDKYEDSLTYDLVGAACKVLQADAAKVLESFGEYWTQYTAQEGYGDLLDLSGSTLDEFLANLDDMHVRVAMVFPELEPPSFESVKRDDGSYELHYHSERDGLAAMVIGMVKGLATRFGVAVSIEQIASRNNSSGHDVFHIREG